MGCFDHDVESAVTQVAYDAIVIGSGPNGLAAAITLARAGWSVQLLEAEDTIGGGMRSKELTLPGFVHDVCSTIHAFGTASPFFRSVPLAEHGVDWAYSPAELAHPLDHGNAAILLRSVEATAARLGDDSMAYRDLMNLFVAHSAELFEDALGPVRHPKKPLLMARFGLRAIQSACGLADRWFSGDSARALFAGLAAHSVMPLEATLTSAIGLMLGVAGHSAGWPVARGGSQKIADGLASYFRSLGGEVVTGRRVESVDELPKARAYLFDVAPRNLSRICCTRLPANYRRALDQYRHGPAAFKLDWALSGPIPWRSPECSLAATVHVGGTLEEVAASEAAMWNGQHSQKPFVLLAQASLFDPTRAPAGKHTGWAYCHVPNGSTIDMTERIEAQVERFAPGFRDLILARHITTPSAFEQHNANYVGGDIIGGVTDWRQLFSRPTIRLDPYSTPAKDIFICSASTPPGAGVHGMCGYFAALSVLRRSKK
jgi:phytoene dehydrogenase-like protein